MGAGFGKLEPGLVGACHDPLSEVRAANLRRRVRIHTVALLTGALKVGEQEDAAGAVRFLSRLSGQNRGEFREIR